ncbi:MAG: DUF6531 domain-containing protein, partial [Lachnospiraceae bacterium]|nr:DUF6531 domain-containing protein [Lachnospiraceae bacterium]
MGEKREIPLAEVMLEGACEYISVQSMEIYTAADTHARAIVSILVDGAISESVCQSAEEQLIKLKLSDGTILFQGYCEECDVKVQNQYKEVTLWALSGSHEADKEKKSRTFQNPSKTLGSILTSVLEEHSIIARIEGDLTIPHIVSQNKETDWEFCVRLANQYQKAVWTDSRTDKVTAHIGNISFGDEEIGADAKLVKTSKEFNDYRSVLANGNTPNPGYQYIYRNMISHNAVIIAGDMTEKGLVTATRLTTNKGVLDNQITIQNARQKAPDYRIQTKDAFTSKILTGKVIGVTSSTVQIEFDVDGQQDKAEAIELPYESILSNSFYNMPDENDKVFVYMDNQGKAVCLGSKRTDTVDEYFLNPKEKAIGALDRVVHFTEKALVLSATRQLYSQESEEQVTLTLDGEQGISVEAPGTIKLSSENEIMIAASIKSIEEIKGSKSLSIDNNYKAKKKLFDAYLEAGGTVSETRARFNKWASDAGDNLLNGLKDMVFWDAWHKADTVELDSETDTYESGNCILRGISIELSVGEVTIRMGMEETPSVLYAYASVYSWLGTEPNENYPQKVDELRDAWEIGLDLLTAGLAIAGTVCLIVGTGGAAAGVLLAAGAALGFARQDYFSGITSLVGCVGAFAKIGQLPAWMTRIGDAVKNISVVAKLRDLATANRSMLAMCQLVYGFGVLVYTVYKTIPQTKERMDNQDTFLGKACEFAIGLLNISNAAISTADTMNNASDTILSGDPVDPIVSHDAGGDNINSTSQIESVTAGDPVDVVSGALIIPFTDIIIPDIIGDFRLVRTYRSVYENKGGMLGSRWLYNIESRIAVSGTCITVLLPDIHKETFICVNGKWQNKTEGRERYILTKSDTGFCLKDSETRETYIYDGEGRIKCKEDRNHNRMEYFYQGNCLEKLVFASGQALYFSYENEKISKICDTAGRECRFWYDGELLTGVQGTNGGKVSYTYTKEGYISRITNENGKCYVTNQYDRKGRVVCQNTADGEEYVFFYDDVNRRTTFTTVSKNTSVTYHYNAKNLVEKTVFEDGNIRERKYDACERVIYERDELNREIFREYDSAGRLLQEKFPTGLSTTYRYDANGNMIEKKDNLGRVTRYEYDDRGNRVYAAYLLDKEHWAENRMTYDVHGRILSFTDAQGNTRTWEYSKPFAQATRSVGAEGETVVCELDEFGRRMAVRSERGTVELSYNMLNFITSVTDEEGNTTCSKYDLTGKRIALIRPNEIDKQHGVSTNYEYDAMDHLIKTINPCGDVMAVQVDSDGRITKEINPNAFDETCEDGDGIEYKYDTRGYLIQVRYPDGGIKSIIRDACGNITKIIKPEEYARAGEHAEGFLYEYDNGNRLVRVRDEQGTVRKCYIYDVAGRVTKEIDAKGYLAAQTDEERIGKLYFYNKTGWLMEKREPIFQNQDGSYMYRLFNYRYDDCGRLIEEKKYLDAQTKESSKGRVLIIRREYDRSGRLKRVSDSTGANAEYTYNEHGQVLTEKVRISENVYKRKKYSYYKNGRLSCVATSTDKKGTTRPFAETHFSYDKNGNLTAIKTPAGHEIRREYDAADRLIREIHTQAYDKVTNETKFGYDRSGNLITITDNDGNISGKSYDMMNRLVMEIAKDGGVNATKYNLDGKIIKRIKPNSFQKQGFEGDGTSYCYDRQGRITQETNAEGNIVKRLYYNCYGEVQSIRDIDDVQIDFGYDYAGRRTSVITGTGVSRQTEYDI